MPQLQHNIQHAARIVGVVNGQLVAKSYPLAVGANVYYGAQLVRL